MYFFLTIFLLVNLCFGLDPPKWIVEEGREQYSEYDECIERRKLDYGRYQNSKRFHGVFAPPNSLVTLQCFDCLDPVDAHMLEDIWKPNESFLNRKVLRVFDKIKESMKSSHQTSDENKEFKKQFYWEFLPFKQNATKSNISWTVLLNTLEPTKSSVKISKMMRNFLRGNKQRFTVGNHFELEILKSSLSDIGWYRCVQRSYSEQKYISQAYFLDILPNYNTKMIKYNKNINALMDFSNYNKELKELGIELFQRQTIWTKCSKCSSNEIGEKRMQISCYLRPNEFSERSNFYNLKNFSFLTIFGEIPCVNSLIPSQLRNKLIKEFPIYEIFDYCKEKCHLLKNETRFVKGYNENGESIVLDKLLPGEFTLNERLPPLKERVSRKLIQPMKKSLLILDCGGKMLGYDGNLIWKKNHIEINGTTTLNTNTNLIISANKRIIFPSVDLESTGIYTCSTWNNETLAIFLVYVIESKEQITEYVSVGQIVLRFIAVLLLVLLYVKEMRKTRKKIDSTEKLL